MIGGLLSLVWVASVSAKNQPLAMRESDRISFDNPRSHNHFVILKG
jgi:hypothetical protein